MYLPLVDPDEMSADLRSTWEIASPGGKRFVGVTAHAPAHAERLFKYYNGVRYGNSLGPKLTELARLAASNDTHCEV
jgi:hypothetical protein